MGTLIRVSMSVLAFPAAVASGCGGDPSGSASFDVDAVEVGILAHDTTWRAAYRLPAGSGAAAAGVREVPSGRDIHLPRGADVRLTLASRDYICIFSAPDLGLRDFASPGLPGEFRFVADRSGTFELLGDELCGLPHTDASRGRIVVEDAPAYQAWVRARVTEETR